MRLLRILAAVLAITLAIGTVAAAEERLRMSTTTSTENSGLLKVLLPPFEQQNNCKVDVVAVGTGKSIKLGEAGDADIVFVHARKLEDKFVADGFGVNRKDVMYNDFVIIGPSRRPGRGEGGEDDCRGLGQNRCQAGVLYFPWRRIGDACEGEGTLAGGRGQARRGLVR